MRYSHTPSSLFMGLSGLAVVAMVIDLATYEPGPLSVLRIPSFLLITLALACAMSELKHRWIMPAKTAAEHLTRGLLAFHIQLVAASVAGFIIAGGNYGLIQWKGALVWAALVPAVLMTAQRVWGDRLD